jgi:hypothetical protein
LYRYTGATKRGLVTTWGEGGGGAFGPQVVGAFLNRGAAVTLTTIPTADDLCLPLANG